MIEKKSAISNVILNSILHLKPKTSGKFHIFSWMNSIFMRHIKASFVFILIIIDLTIRNSVLIKKRIPDREMFQF